MSKSPKVIWILEDDPGCQFVYEEILGIRYPVRVLSTVQALKDALENAAEPRPDLVIADIRLPDQSFVSFLDSEEAALFSLLPFLVVSSVDDLDVLRLCFEKGAVDYITKPFGKAELIIKTERILAARHGNLNRDDEVSVDPTSLTVSRGRKVSTVLTPKEFQLVALMHQAPNWRLSREEMITRVWGSVTVSAKTLDVHLFHLRKKLSPLALDILYVPPQSYRLLTRD